MLTVGAHAPVHVIFDSGAGGSIVGKEFAQSAGLPEGNFIDIGSPGGGTPVKGYMTQISSARLGAADIDVAHAVVMDLPARLSDVAGVISPNAFTGRLVRFEFARSRAIVMDKIPANVPTGPPYPYGGERGHPLPATEIDVAGTKIIAHLDSGSKYGLQVPLEMAKQLPLCGPLVATEPTRMINAEHAAFNGRIVGTVHVGPLTLTDPDVQFVEGAPIGNIGIQILKQTTLVLDPEAERSWLLLTD
jgi:hypothetical protein